MYKQIISKDKNVCYNLQRETTTKENIYRILNQSKIILFQNTQSFAAVTELKAVGSNAFMINRIHLSTILK